MAIPKIPQDGSWVLTIGTTANPTVVSTAGLTVTVLLTDDGGTTTSVGTSAGAAAGTAVTVTCDMSLVEPGHYQVEAIADYGQANPVTLVPNATTGFPYVIDVFDVEAIA